MKYRLQSNLSEKSLKGLPSVAHPTALSDFALFVAPESEVAPQGSLQIYCFARGKKGKKNDR